jgi:hypothetical protein
MTTSGPISFVYLLRAQIPRSARGWSQPSNGPYKIGISRDPIRRINDLSLVAGVTISLIHIIPAAQPRVLETALHEWFVDKAIGHEWFALDEVDVRCVQQL